MEEYVYFGGADYREESRRYEAMKADIEERIGRYDDDEYDILEDVASHGADAGFSGFTYTTECVEFYEKHEDAIYDMLRDAAEDFGYDNIEQMIATFNRSDMLDSSDGRKNLLTWYALEEVARRETEV